MLGKLQCWLLGAHKWSSRPTPGLKVCRRCGATAAIKTRQQKRDDTTKELTEKAVKRETANG